MSLSRPDRKLREFGINYGNRGLALGENHEPTEEEALAMLVRYRRTFSSPIADAHRKRELRWARLVLAAHFVLGMVAVSILLKAFFAALAAFSPGAGHGF